MSEYYWDDVSPNMIEELKNFQELFPEHELQLRNVLCDRCDGEGVITNPAFNGPVYGYEDETWDDEYISPSKYDVKCPACGGAKVLKEVDANVTDPFAMAAWAEWQSDSYDSAQERLAELRAGC